MSCEFQDPEAIQEQYGVSNDPVTVQISLDGSSRAERFLGTFDEISRLTLDIDRNEKFIETLNQIIEIWTSDPPYNIQGKYNSISTVNHYNEVLGQGVILKPYQKSTPPIFGTVVAPFSKGVIGLGERGWIPVSANFLQP